MNGRAIASGRVFALAADPMAEVIETNAGIVPETRHELPENADWTFPAASVSAVELDTKEV